MKETTHRFVETNGIKMHIAEAGHGPLVIMCHGFPELWYTWRHQLTAVAEAGFHAVAPDQRGYGQTDKPERVEDYNIFQLTGDIVGLVKALGEQKAVIIGHDFGANVAMNSALLRPDIFNKVVLMSVPFIPRVGGNTPPTEIMKKKYGNDIFYQVLFQEPGKVEAEIEELGVYKFIRGILYTNSGSPPPEQQFRYMYHSGEKFPSHMSIPDKLPEWLTEQDVEYFGQEYARTGFSGGLNWYRNIDRNWELTPFLDGIKLQQPALFIAGELDPVLAIYKGPLQSMEKNVPNLQGKHIFPGIGHSINQERPDDVSSLVVAFLKNN